MIPRVLALLISAGVLIADGAHGQAPQPPSHLKVDQKARGRFEKAALAKGDGEGAEKEIRAWIEGSPEMAASVRERARATAYMASSVLLQARDAFWPLTKVSQAKRGMKLLDAAVEIDRQDVETRFVRLRSNSSLPHFLRNEPQLEEDARFLLLQPDEALSGTSLTPSKIKELLLEKVIFRRLNADEQAQLKK